VGDEPAGGDAGADAAADGDDDVGEDDDEEQEGRAGQEEDVVGVGVEEPATAAKMEAAVGRRSRGERGLSGAVIGSDEFDIRLSDAADVWASRDTHELALLSLPPDAT
jgi:hypothetical protein